MSSFFFKVLILLCILFLCTIVIYVLYSKAFWRKRKKYFRNISSQLHSSLSKAHFRVLQENGLFSMDEEIYRGFITGSKPNLFRYVNDKLPKTIFLIGAGAIENSWKPLFKLFKTEDKNLICHLLARTVSLAKEDYSLLGILPKEKLTNLPKLWDLRRKIAIFCWLFEYKNEYKIKNIPNELEQLLKLDSTAIITTNWTNTFNKLNNNILFLHGHIWSPETILLPTEFPLDEHRSHENTHNGFERLEFARWLTTYWMGVADELVLWGIALNTYDVELGTLLKSKTIKRVTVIDVDPTPARVISRINNLPVKWINPETNTVEEISSKQNINSKFDDTEYWDKLYIIYNKYSRRS